MLADSCEAAMKANGIEDSEEAEVLIRRIVKSKIDMDQLISSGLLLRRCRAHYSIFPARLCRSISQESEVSQ